VRAIAIKPPWASRGRSCRRCHIHRQRPERNRFDQQGFEQAASYFQQALDLDPAFVVAASKLAAAYLVLGEWGFMPPAVAFEPARRAEELALKLDPNLAEARAGLGRIHGVYDWIWSAADRELKLAHALAPNDARILFMSSLQSLSTGHWDEALKLVNASLAQDPLNPSGYFVLYQIQLRRGRLSEAEAAIRRTLAISATFSRAHFYLGRVLEEIRALQSHLVSLADKQTPCEGIPTEANLVAFMSGLSEAWRNGEVRPTHLPVLATRYARVIAPEKIPVVIKTVAPTLPPSPKILAQSTKPKQPTYLGPPLDPEIERKCELR
jgi:Flp pilus assembly protein TadD